MKPLKLTDEESVFARQLFKVRRRIEQLVIEENTQVDRLLTILRGHQAQVAEGTGGYMVSRHVVDNYERLVVTEHGKNPFEVSPVQDGDDDTRQ